MQPCKKSSTHTHSNSDETYGFKNWRDPGAFTPQGIDGIINSLAFTAFSMQGMEIVGITVRLL